MEPAHLLTENLGRAMSKVSIVFNRNWVNKNNTMHSLNYSLDTKTGSGSSADNALNTPH